MTQLEATAGWNAAATVSTLLFYVVKPWGFEARTSDPEMGVLFWSETSVATSTTPQGADNSEVQQWQLQRRQKLRCHKQYMNSKMHIIRIFSETHSQEAKLSY
jgi:hypothetical protein